ncbi:dihydrodipicolinate synthase family protein [Photobacterium sp. DNB23_23_1]
MNKLFGVTVAMVTPLDNNDQIDVLALKKLTEMLVKKGVNCLYPCGTTGEMLRLSLEERKLVAETVVDTVAGRIPVFVHVGAMTMEETIILAQHTQSIGAQGIGIVTPQFFPASDRELENYFVTVANCVSPDFPVYLYNIPQCAANDVSPDVVKKVADQCSNVIGIKYSFSDLNTTLSYLTVKEGFSVLHGYDKFFNGFIQSGCDGTVSGCSCVFPEPFVNMYKSYQEGNFEEAQYWQKACVKFSDVLKSGSNMAIFKSALNMRGLNVGYMRLPQLDLTKEESQSLKLALLKLCDKYEIPFSV